LCANFLLFHAKLFIRAGANAGNPTTLATSEIARATRCRLGSQVARLPMAPGAGAVQTETNVWEWDGPKAKELSTYGVARKPGAIFAFQHADGTLEVTMTDGKPSGWTASGHGIVTLATGSWASLNGKKYEWTGKGTGPNVFEGDYTFK
jgi:hypothetical protein